MQSGRPLSSLEFQLTVFCRHQQMMTLVDTVIPIVAVSLFIVVLSSTCTSFSASLFELTVDLSETVSTALLWRTHGNDALHDLAEILKI